MKNNKYIFLFLPVIIALSIVTGIFLASFLLPSTNNESTIFPVAKRFNTATKLNEILNFIEDTYVDSVNKKELLEKSIASMLSNLDPHSYYIPAADFNAMNDPLNGSFEGIGVEFRIKDDTLLIISPIAKGPSAKLGIKAGDRIIQVDTTHIAGNGITNAKIIKLLKGPIGSKVAVDIVRRGNKKIFHYVITRGKIPIFSVESPYMINDTTAYIKITRFAKTTHAEFLAATKKLLKDGMKNLIIDLRGNGGGLLSAATAIADEILPKNKMIVYTKGRARAREDIYATDKGILQHTKIAILINENSASASEILAGAIQDNDRGTIIGRRSFGKGLVQEQVVWPDSSALRLTVARYYTPTGRCIQKPYGKNLADYNADTYKRYLDGELLSADSIHFNDSLRYYTPQGKVVYGGGGIMPDIFVPLDTNGGTDYLYAMRSVGLIQNFALNYVDNHREKLGTSYQNAIAFKNHFKIDNHLFNTLIQYANKKGIKRNLVQIQESKNIIIRDLKAAISRNLFNDFGYYTVINQYDKTVKKAIESFKK